MSQSSNTDPAIAIQYRMERAEREIEQIKVQLNLYVPTRENELRLQSINAAVQRIEQDIKSVKDQVTGFTTKLQEQRESQDKLLISILWGGISVLIGLGVLVLAGYLTHFFH